MNNATLNLVMWFLQAIVVVDIAAIASHYLKKARPSARLALWQITLLAVLLLPVIRPWRQEVIAMHDAPFVRHIPAQMLAAQAILHPVQSIRAVPIPGPEYWLFYLIAFGALIRLTMLAAGLYRLRQYRRTARPFATEGPWHSEAELLISDSIPSPVTFGFVNPVILLPTHFATLTPDLRETVLYHEILHIRRRDWLFAVVEEIARGILWFHPGVWWTVREIQLAREVAVDREVVETLDARDTYVDALLAIAAAPARREWAPAPLFLRRKHLKLRVVSILREVNMSKTKSFSALIAGFSALAVSCWFVTGALPLKAQTIAVRDDNGVTVETHGANLLHRYSVVYPASAIEGNVEGTVEAQVRIDGSGSVADALILSGPDELRKPVLQSLLNWHYAHDAANSTRLVSITFKKPPVAANVVVVHADLPSSGITAVLDNITVNGLPDSERDALLAKLPVRAGDTVTPEARAQINKVVKAFDEHLTVGNLYRTSKGSDTPTLSLTIGIGDPLTGTLGTLSMAPPTRSTPAPPGAVRVGGAVAANNMVSQVPPVYPPLAKAARVQGTVRFDAVIGKDGTVQSLSVVSGPPLLIAAAEAAVKQWTYKPTLLNKQPVEVATTIDVNFTLTQ